MRHSRRIRGIAFAIVSLLVSVVIGRAQQPAATTPDPLGALQWRYIGPVGNRVSAIAGVSGDPSIYYAGAASGGVWKTTDGGIYWEPLFDGQSSQSIGAIAVAPSDPNVVWVGTGEQWVRSHISIGDGIYKSTDAGRTWTPPASRRAGASRASSFTRRTPTSCSPARWERRTVRSRSAACFARPTAERHGTVCSSSTKTPGAPTCDGPVQPEDSVRRHVAVRNQDMGPLQRRARQRTVSDPPTAA